MNDDPTRSDSAPSFGDDNVGYDPITETYHARFVADSGTIPTGEITMTVVDIVAIVTDSDPVAMTPLFEVIDPEALTALIAATRERPVEVSFSYEDCRVTVSSSRTVVVEPPET